MSKQIFFVLVMACGIAMPLRLAAQTQVSAADRATLAQGGDPYLPPASRQPRAEAAPSGPALQALVERKLRASFDAADSARSGSLSRDDAAHAGWGFVAQNFDAIDTGHQGRVSFEQVRRFVLRRQAAQ